MASNGYRAGYNEDGVMHNTDYKPDSGSDERYGGDSEKGPAVGVGYKGKEDPFGDETNSEVKYRTMAWW